MEVFLVTFGAFVIVVAGMSIGVMFKRKPIAGSCGGLNAISDADHCLVCGTPVDPNSPLKERLSECPRKKAARELEKQTALASDSARA